MLYDVTPVLNFHAKLLRYDVDIMFLSPVIIMNYYSEVINVYKNCKENSLKTLLGNEFQVIF